MYTVRYLKDGDRTESYHRNKLIAMQSLSGTEPWEYDSDDEELGFYYDWIGVYDKDGSLIEERYHYTGETS